MALLLHAAQADLELRLGSSLGGDCGRDLGIDVDGVIVVLLILPGPADAVAGFRQPGAVAKAPDQSFVGLPALVPLFDTRIGKAQTQKPSIAQARQILKRLLIAEDDELLDRIRGIAQLE